MPETVYLTLRAKAGEEGIPAVLDNHLKLGGDILIHLRDVLRCNRHPQMILCVSLCAGGETGHDLWIQRGNEIRITGRCEHRECLAFATTVDLERDLDRSGVPGRDRRYEQTQIEVPR